MEKIGVKSFSQLPLLTKRSLSLLKRDQSVKNNSSQSLIFTLKPNVRPEQSPEEERFGKYLIFHVQKEPRCFF